ncbi:hypothetical protein GCM10007886_17420 [Methylobacterium gregans]|nr:hypothetical protein GCM10007886_17420 [Methylobacterium gregans]
MLQDMKGENDCRVYELCMRRWADSIVSNNERKRGSHSTDAFTDAAQLVRIPRRRAFARELDELIASLDDICRGFTLGCSLNGYAQHTKE